ncbi:MAG TPA: 3-deoxy-D-manno-octulosonic acid transferase [Candidatus Binatia bacterium]
MWYFFYNLTLTLALGIVLPFLPLVFVLGARYRDGLGQRFAIYPQEVRRLLASSRPIWIHAASVGEVRSAEPLVRELKARAPARPVLVSTFTATGNRIARGVPGVDAVIYLPLDLSWTVRRALNAFNPSLLVIIETEIWPNLLRAAFRRGIPNVLLSGRLSEPAFARYSVLRGFFSRVLRFFTILGMQSPADAARIMQLGADEKKVAVVGSLKFAARHLDRDGEKTKSVRDWGRPLVVAGSSHRGEEEILLKALKSARARFPNLSLVLAPRHPERFAEVERLLIDSPFVFQRKSRLPADQYFAYDVLLLDTVGELPEFFAAGDIAFVGGSLVEAGGHNVLEPARLQKAILFGPHMANFKSIAEEMKRRRAAIEVRDAEELAHALVDLLGDTDKRRRMGESACQIAGDHRDALARNLQLAERYL